MQNSESFSGKSVVNQLKGSAHDGYLSSREGFAKGVFLVSFTPSYFIGWIAGRFFGK